MLGRKPDLPERATAVPKGGIDEELPITYSLDKFEATSLALE
jgi:hypothetical protein